MLNCLSFRISVYGLSPLFLFQLFICLLHMKKAMRPFMFVIFYYWLPQELF